VGLWSPTTASRTCLGSFSARRCVAVPCRVPYCVCARLGSIAIVVVARPWCSH
jgi:hypothetical protein